MPSDILNQDAFSFRYVSTHGRKSQYEPWFAITSPLNLASMESYMAVSPDELPKIQILNTAEYLNCCSFLYRINYTSPCGGNHDTTFQCYGFLCQLIFDFRTCNRLDVLKSNMSKYKKPKHKYGWIWPRKSRLRTANFIGWILSVDSALLIFLFKDVLYALAYHRAPTKFQPSTIDSEDLS